MDIGKALATSAVLGILAAACGGAQETAKPATAPATSDNPGEKHGCGNHDGGSCGAMTAPAPATPNSH